MSTIPATAVVTYNLPDEGAMNGRANGALCMANGFEIFDDVEYSYAAEELAGVKRRIAAIEEQRVKITGPLNDALNAVNDLFYGPRTLLEQAEKMWKRKLLGFLAKVEAEAAEAQRIAEIAAQAKRDRLAAEAVAIQVKATEEIEKLTADPQTGELDFREVTRIRQAAIEQANALEQTAAVIVAAPVAAEQPKVRGLSVAKGLDWEVSDHVAFVKFVAANVDANPDLGDYLVIDSVKMRARVKASGVNLNFPGIVVKSKSTMRSAK